MIGPIVEGALYLYVLDQRGDAWEDVSVSEKGLAVLHELVDGV